MGDISKGAEGIESRLSTLQKGVSVININIKM